MSTLACLLALGNVLVYVTHYWHENKFPAQLNLLPIINGYKINRRIYQVMGRLSQFL
jgi:hypothetical protein